MKTRGLFALAGASIIIALGVSPALAQEPQWLSYAVKFVCGSENAVPDRELVSGRYRTLINIHNPHYLQSAAGGPPGPLVFYKKAVLALPQGEDPVRPSCKQFEFLDADFALKVTCGNIIKLFQLSGIPITSNYEGFLVIEVPPQGAGNFAPELDVTAVYVARHRTGTNADITDYDVQTMDVEQIAPRAIIGVPINEPCQPD